MRWLPLVALAVACGSDAGSGPVHVATVQVTPETFSIRLPGAQQLTVTARDAGGQVITGRPVSFRSSALAVATVSAGGLVQAVGPGSVDLTATVEGVEGIASGMVTVPPPQPAGRWIPGMAWDEVRHQVVMFGGSGSTTYRDLWGWDGTQWTLLSNNQGPSARDGAVMAFDPGLQKVLLWGGRASDGVTRLTDTWTWDGSVWSQATATGVGPYEHAAGGFDVARGRFVVVTTAAIQGAPGQLETWEWDGGPQWVRRATTGPASFTVPLASSLEFISGGQSLVGLFGDALGAPNTQLWTWNGTAWSPLGAGPAIDPGGPLVATGPEDLVAFAGEGTGSGRTWGWNGTGWSLASATGPSAPRFGPGMAYDAARHRIVLFGGWTGSAFLTDTWEFDGVSWRLIPPP